MVEREEGEKRNVKEEGCVCERERERKREKNVGVERNL